MGIFFDEEFYTRSNRTGGSQICFRINQAMAPFHPGQVSLYVYETGPADKRLEINISALPNDPFITNVLELERFIDHPEVFTREIGVRAGQHFASVETLPVGDHVVLGYN